MLKSFIRMLQQTDLFYVCFIASLEALVSFLIGNGGSLAPVWNCHHRYLPVHNGHRLPWITDYHDYGHWITMSESWQALCHGSLLIVATGVGVSLNTTTDPTCHCLCPPYARDIIVFKEKFPSHKQSSNHENCILLWGNSRGRPTWDQVSRSEISVNHNIFFRHE